MNDPELSTKVTQWIHYGEDDLRLARYAAAMGEECPWRLVACHAQQAAEKWLKALLVCHRIDFPYTHNIRLLLELCAPLTSWGESLAAAEELTPFATSLRYPGEEEQVLPAEATRAIELAEAVRQRVQMHLAERGLGWDISATD